MLDYVRARAQDSETLNMVYVVDAHGGLIDDICMRSFLLAPLDKTVVEIMDNRFDALKATDEHATAINLFRRTSLTALPVTDADGVLIGIVTIDDVLEVTEAEYAALVSTRPLHLRPSSPRWWT